MFLGLLLCGVLIIQQTTSDVLVILVIQILMLLPVKTSTLTLTKSRAEIFICLHVQIG